MPDELCITAQMKDGFKLNNTPNAKSQKDFVAMKILYIKYESKENMI